MVRVLRGGGFDDDDPISKDMDQLNNAINSLFDRGSFTIDVNDKGLLMWAAIDMK